MFGKSTDDIAVTLTRMQDEARIACRHDQYAMARKMAEWMQNDGRFDAFADKEKLAREAMDARSHGRELDLSGRLRIDTEGATTAPISDWRRQSCLILMSA